MPGVVPVDHGVMIVVVQMGGLGWHLSDAYTYTLFPQGLGVE